ncbi:MAG: hypothetical protein JWN32_3734, partial [Solirubrobacterales bacterium]|nr:hypothetical protein [Solirubrobacterales bacterium]
MAVALRPGPFAVLPKDRIAADSEREDARLRRSVGPVGFVALGLAVLDPPAERD